MNGFEEIRNLDTRELIGIFQSQLHPNRDNAFYALVERFKVDFLKICEVRCGRFGQTEEVAIELFENVFKAYAKKPNFNFSNTSTDDDDHAFLAYLSGIARNELTNIYRDQKRKREGKWSDGNETIVTSIPPLCRNPTLKSRIIHKIISDLPYSHRVIYCTYKSYESTGCNLPRKLQKELREHLNITQDTVRYYKKEALDKIKVALTGLEMLEDEAAE